METNMILLLANDTLFFIDIFSLNTFLWKTFLKIYWCITILCILTSKRQLKRFKRFYIYTITLRYKHQNTPLVILNFVIFMIPNIRPLIFCKWRFGISLELLKIILRINITFLFTIKKICFSDISIINFQDFKNFNFVNLK